jgi:hypothetical protein
MSFNQDCSRSANRGTFSLSRDSAWRALSNVKLETTEKMIHAQIIARHIEFLLAAVIFAFVVVAPVPVQQASS